MTEVDLTTWFLTALTLYGPLLLGVTLFVGALGVPLPGTLFLLATGAFAEQGSIDWVTASFLALGGVVLGDSIGYWIGRSTSRLIHPRYTQAQSWQKAQDRFNRHGGTAIYLTRFLFTPFAVPTNFIAGGSGYTLGQFLRYDVLGELTWIVLYGGLGYLAGSQWEHISQFVTNYSGWIMALMGVGMGCYFLQRSRSQARKEALALAA